MSSYAVHVPARAFEMQPLAPVDASILPFRRTPKVGLPRVARGSMKDIAAQLSAHMMLVAHDRDRAAFIKVYQYFAPRVKSFLLGKNVPAATADEILQEVMLAVWNKASSYKPDRAAVSTWIFTIARNKYVDRVRQEMKPSLDAEDPSLQPADSPESSEQLLEGQRAKAVRAAMENLPQDQRDVIFLSFMEGLAHAEISERLGLPLGTVKSRIRLGFQRLRKELGEVQ